MTRYAANPLAGLGDGTSPAGLEFIQGVVAPSFALKTGPGSSIGVAVNLVYQELEARGFEHFDSPAFSVAPGHVTNRGRDHSLGVGLRVGWLAHVLPSLTLGAAYQPRIRMSKFERYKGLLADGGNFDVPENYTVGAALSLMPGLTGLIDIQRIQFGGVRSFGNRADCFLATTCLLGTKEGPGSGWRNTTVYKLGLAYDWSSRLTLRGGLSFLRQPIPPSQTFLNVFAPAVAEKHFSLGATWTVRPDLELTAAYMHGFENRVQGRNSIPPGPPGVGAGGGEADIHMKQRALGIAVGWRM
jgi:long-chain fatty acid transport protein